jgi:SAM-dependent methyltransferase
MNKIDFLSFNWLALKVNNNSFARHCHLMRGLVIDLGCGPSPYKQDILKVADQYIGVDWQLSQHDQNNVDIFADLTKELPFSDNYADTIVSFQVMEHLPEPMIFLTECLRILKPGGRIIITVPFMWHVHEEPHDYFRYTRYGLEYMLGKGGFTDILVEENTGFWQMWILKFNYHSARYARGIFKYLWIPVWWLGQVISPILDSIDSHGEETASYTVIARK